MAFLTSRRPLSEMNVVPLVDVMLVLLVIFMMTTPLLTQGVKVSLPKMSAKPISTEQQKPIIVTVDASGNFYLNLADAPNQPITARTLTFLLTQQFNLAAMNVERPVYVRGDKNVNYGKVVEAMVLLQQAGAKSVGLITDPAAVSLPPKGEG
ncbi:MAG: hypothetical protein ACD_45C00044G0001 [uncultured bacterium]|nr:MAG: hypothetical protein ACD_45C00044G0001 [uncultured bacterium]OGT57446.1 MAG: protein TolR [Gammaproteobacteria bacterium RIFCSPHIGHO2_12_FULL_42_10]